MPEASETNTPFCADAPEGENVPRQLLRVVDDVSLVHENLRQGLSMVLDVAQDLTEAASLGHPISREWLDRRATEIRWLADACMTHVMTLRSPVSDLNRLRATL